MAATLQAVLDLARKPLNDAKDGAGSDSNCRFTDAALLDYARTGLLRLFRRRPDLFIGSFATPPSLTLAKTDPFALPDEYVEVVADYVTARCETHDDEAATNGRASKR